jgi:hypothetical protein
LAGQRIDTLSLERLRNLAERLVAEITPGQVEERARAGGG